MPGATVKRAEGQGGEIPETPTRVYGVGRGGHTVEVIGTENEARIFVKVVSGPSKGCTYHLPAHELFVPEVQPLIDLPNVPLPHDVHWDEPVDDPASATCPHRLTSNREMVYDADMGLWVHGVQRCRRPTASHLRTVAGADGMRW